MGGRRIDDAMSMFGPFYPARLQTAVNHAERAAGLLSALEAGAPQPDEWAWAWLTGRASEIERLVEHVATAWRRGEVAEPEAAAAVERYLGLLHEGMQLHLGIASPACCVASLAVTVPSTGSGGAAREPPAARPRDGGTTVQGPLSIEDLLDGLFRP
jgi:hypothetical protein